MLKILKANIDQDDLYDSWVKESNKVFSKFSDDDFFSDKVQHIYFYSDINDDSVNSLQQILYDASKTKIDNSNIYTSPKPICLHLNSHGGSVSSTDFFYTIFQTIRVPLCVIIEALAASAATDIALLAPYRIMLDFSSYLIHDGFGQSLGKTSNIIKSDYSYLHTMLYYKNLLKKRTLLSDNDITVFLERDLYIDSAYCLEKKIIDRILYLPKINNPDYYVDFSDLQLNLSNFLKKTNMNHIYISNELYNTDSIIIDGNNLHSNISAHSNLYNLSIILDNNFLIKKNNVKPIIIHFKSSYEFVMDARSNPLELIQLNYRLAMIQKRIPIIAFIEGSQYFDILSTILMCPIRIMMKPSIIQNTFAFRKSRGYGMKTIDIIDNSLFIFNNVVKFYKNTSNLPNNFYKIMRTKIINLSPKDLLKYNIIHLCLDITKKNILQNDIINYLQLNKITGIYNNNNSKIKIKINSNKKNKDTDKIKKIKKL